MNQGLDLAVSIRQAFEFTPPPQNPEDRILTGEEWEETKSFWGRPWDKLRLVDFNKNTNCLGFFSGESFSYFFGALMYLCLKEENFESGALDMLFMHGYSDVQNPMICSELTKASLDWMSEIGTLLSKRQLGLIGDFVRVRETKVGTPDNDDARRFFSHLSRISKL